ncbi:hypothetical protein GCM10008931_44370 [Oceanobacillus oncorhynchi subsp. oncorhynchi]|uniref:hypothetical protein n=1 Tax=Oceanobacillus oncorhynchi TaxID=545501 RepID=UPI0031D17322
MEIKQENASELKELLYNTIKNAPNVSYAEWIDSDDYGYSNRLEFIVKNKSYIIVWYWNESKLYFQNGLFCFDKVEVSGTWPNDYKNNLQFYLNGRVVGVIPLEEY